MPVATDLRHLKPTLAGETAGAKTGERYQVSLRDGRYKYCLRNDLFLILTLGDPQVDRSEQPQNEQRKVGEDEEVALHVVEETKGGVIVTGGKQLSTAAPHSNECNVSISATRPLAFGATP